MKKRWLISVPFIFLMMELKAQELYQLPEIQAPDSVENVWVKPLYSDSLVSNFLIVVKQQVPAHMHEHHSESIYVLEGEGRFKLGDSSYHIRPGRFFSIPAGTPHAVQTIGETPLKVLSIQAPQFDGSDRIWIKEE